MTKKAVSLLLLLCFIACKPDFSHRQISKLVQHFQKKPPQNLAQYWQELEGLVPNDSFAQSIRKIRSDPLHFTVLTLPSQKFICRSLGIYTRSHYRQEMLELLGELVAIPSYRKKGIPPHKNSAIIKIGTRIAGAAQKYKLGYRNHANRIFELFLRGKTSENLGIYTHADVVPANPALWRTPEGSPLDPFQMQIIDGRIYGRGTQDDKGSIVAALSAMSTLRASGIPLRRGVRLLIESTEETGGDALEYYKKKGEPLPPYNIVLDSKYPLVIAEKGAGLLQLSFAPANLKAKQDIQVYSVSGGAAVNQIPALSIVKIKSWNPEKLKQALIPLARRLEKESRKKNSKELKIDIITKTKAKEVQLELHGVSAHSSEPESGLNPLAYALVLLSRAFAEGIPFAQNEYMQAAQVAADLFSLDYLGEKSGLSHSDNFMGPLTFALTQLEKESPSSTKRRTKKQSLHLRINIRLPRGLSPQRLEERIRKKLKTLQNKNSIEFGIYFKVAEPMYRKPKGAWIETLLNVFQESTGQTAKPISGAGTTSAQQIPNGLSFGPSMPKEKYRGHTANEYEKLSDFLLSSQMLTEMLCRITNLEQMQ